MRYQHMGNLVILGRYDAVVELGQIKFTGIVAWFLWLVVHLLTLPGIRNQFLVSINWIWSCLFCDRLVRLIFPIPPIKQLPLQHDTSTWIGTENTTSKEIQEI